MKEENKYIMRIITLWITVLLLAMCPLVFGHDKFPVEKLDRRVKDLGVLESGWVECWEMRVDQNLYCWIAKAGVIKMFIPQKARENMIKVKRLKNDKWQIDITHLTKKVSLYENPVEEYRWYKVDKIVWEK